jgi:hypothetical protein
MFAVLHTFCKCILSCLHNIFTCMTCVADLLMYPVNLMQHYWIVLGGINVAGWTRVWCVPCYIRPTSPYMIGWRHSGAVPVFTILHAQSGERSVRRWWWISPPVWNSLQGCLLIHVARWTTLFLETLDQCVCGALIHTLVGRESNVVLQCICILACLYMFLYDVWLVTFYNLLLE